MWVPADTVARDTRVLMARDTRVLMARIGTAVEVLVDDPESGWSWCRSADGAEGWVMNRALSAE